MKTVSPTSVRFGLKGRLVLLTLVVGTVPLVLAMGTAYLQGTRELQASIGASFAALATESARALDLVLRHEMTSTRRIATDPVVVDWLLTRAATAPALDDGLQRWNTRDPVLLREILDGPVALRLAYDGDSAAPGQTAPRAAFVTDADGRLVASTTSETTYLSRGEAWWRRAMTSDLEAGPIGNTLFDPAVQIYVVELSAPVVAPGSTRRIGVVHRIFDAKAYVAPMLSPTRFGATGHVMLIDGHGTVISCPVLPTGTHLADDELLALVTPSTPGWARTPSDGHGGRAASLVGYSPLVETNRVMPTGEGWHTFAWQSSRELFSPMTRLFGSTAVIGVMAIGLLAILGYFAAARVVSPIYRLREGAAMIGRNELTEPLIVRTGDEIEQLADELNRMHVRLQRAFSGLNKEVRVLQASNEQILDSMPNPIVMLEDERVQFVNRAARRALALDDGADTHAMLFDLVPMTPVSREYLRDELRAHADHRSRSEDHSAQPSRRPGSVIAPRDPLAAVRNQVEDTASTELTIGGRTYRHKLFRIDVPSSEAGWTGLVLWDTTSDGQLYEQLIQAEKRAGLGVLTSGIGHELNNPLFGILSLSEAIRDERDPGRIKEHAAEIGHAAKRMARIIRDFAGASQRDHAELRDDVNVNEQLDLALQVVGLTHGVAGLHVRRQYQPVPTIRGVPEDIGQVFVSLITNSIQAMKGKGTVDLRTAVSSDAVIVSIHDSGPGISKSSASKIFDPFFTTKAPGQGTGLGLTVARRIVQRYGGHIRLDHAGGPGAVIVVEFPIVHEEVEVVSDAARETERRIDATPDRHGR
jgi:signal transduction histidine kinase